VFDRLFSDRFPVVHPSLGIFLVLSDAQGKYDIRVEFRNAADQILSAMEGIRLEVPHRLVRVVFGVQTRLLPVPAPGNYFFKLFFNGVFTMDIPLRVDLVGGTT
jgi:hypothetical protein